MTTPLRKQFDVQLTVQDNERAVVAQISTTAVDRDGEVLLSQGCDASDFLKSPTVFFNHDYTQPVGKCVAITRHRDRLEAKTIFATRPADHQGPWLPDTILSLFQQGVIKGFSVGFLPIEGRKPSRLDRDTFGPSVRYVYSKWKMLEYSVAPLPANQQALAIAVSKGMISKADADRLFPHALPASPPVKRRRILLVVPGKKQFSLDHATRIEHQLLKLRGHLYA